MPPEDSNAESKHRAFRLTSGDKLSTKERIARACIILALFTLLASTVVACTCPEFFAVMAAFSTVALICGGRLQRVLSAGLLLIAIACFIIQFRAEWSNLDRARRTQEMSRQRTQSQ